MHDPHLLLASWRLAVGSSFQSDEQSRFPVSVSAQSHTENGWMHRCQVYLHQMLVVWSMASCIPILLIVHSWQIYLIFHLKLRKYCVLMIRLTAIFRLICSNLSVKAQMLVLRLVSWSDSLTCKCWSDQRDEGHLGGMRMVRLTILSRSMHHNIAKLHWEVWQDVMSSLQFTAACGTYFRSNLKKKMMAWAII